MLGGVKGQFRGGVMTYFSVGGSIDWQKACLKSQVFGILPCFTASAISRRRFICPRTGAKTLEASHW